MSFLNLGALWGLLTGVLCLGSFFVVPLPFLRVGIVAIVMFIALFAYHLAK